MKRMMFAAAAALGGAALAPAVAQDAPPSPPPPACATEAAPYRDFDFWIGDWEVFDLDGVKLGDNRVSRREDGCLLLEEWTSVRGGAGTSLNLVDPQTGRWRQVWMSRDAFIDYEGGLDGAAMALEGTIAYTRGGAFAFRGRWTPLPDGAVRQDFHQHNPDTDAWEPWFTGIYRRRPVEDAP